MTDEPTAVGAAQRLPPVRVLISYAHADEDHREQVRQFWTFLRANGVDARLDRLADNHQQEWSAWADGMMDQAQFVLVIASPAYRARAEGRAPLGEGRGVQWEARRARDLLYRAGEPGVATVVAVVLPGASEKDLPDWLTPAGRSWYPIEDFTRTGAEKLLRLLTGQDDEQDPPLGAVPVLPPSLLAAVAQEKAPVGSMPGVWNIPLRNPLFTGRKELLDGLGMDRSLSRSATIRILTGLGGVGKTALATEFAHVAAGELQAAWWINAEQVDLIPGQFQALAVDLRLVAPQADLQIAVAEARRWLRQHDRWLVIFDNAEDPHLLAEWLPAGPGQILITARTQTWTQVGTVSRVSPFTREESVSLLRSQVAGLPMVKASAIAERLGDLPLALAQAAAFIDSGVSADTYLESLADDLASTLDQGRPVGYPRGLASSVDLTLEKLGQEPAQLRLLYLLACLASAPISVGWLVKALPTVRDGLKLGTLSAVQLQSLCAQLSGSGLVDRVALDGLEIHRLLRDIIRRRLRPPERERFRHWAAAVLVIVRPGDPGDPRIWDEWRHLVPHIAELNRLGAREQDFRRIACEAAWALLESGDHPGGTRLAGELRSSWSDLNDDDDLLVIRAGGIVARGLRDAGHYAAARDIDEPTLDRVHRLFSDDHPFVLECAHYLAIDLRELGDVSAAIALDQDVLKRRQRVLGTGTRWPRPAILPAVSC